MDLGFEGGFSCFSKSVNEKMHPDWIEERNGDRVLLSRTKFEIVFANDIKPEAKTAWTSWFGRGDIYYVGSIVDLLQNSPSIFPQNIDIVAGGFPCQDFSLSGKRLGFHSMVSHTGSSLEEPSDKNRGMLYMQMRNVIMLCRPKMFVAENVKGLTNLGDAKTIIEHDFASAGDYLVVPAQIMQAADYGVPQSRERVIFFGFKKSDLTHEALTALSCDIIPSEYDPYPIKTHGTDAMPYATCFDVLHDLPEPWNSTDPDQRAYSGAKYQSGKCQGQTEIRMDSIAPAIRSEHHGNIEFRRLSKEHGGRHDAELAQNLPERRLSVRECARIQTFPDEYRFITPWHGKGSVSANTAYKLIGNAVPPLMAYAVAKNLEEKWRLYFG